MAAPIPSSTANFFNFSDLQRVHFPTSELATESAAEWIWEGYLTAGSVTLLTSQWKVGKTTLVANLLSRLQSGGELAGQAVSAARAQMLSEESQTLWRARSRRITFGPEFYLYCRPFMGKPSHDEWRALLDQITQRRLESGLNLLVIDSLAFFAPRGAENHADSMLAVLRPLEQLTAAGMAVLILHHPRKGEVRAGQAPRGTGALSAYCDILVEMQGIDRASMTDRRRRLLGWSRHEETPRDVVIELNPDGLDYSVCLYTPDDDSEEGLATAIEVLAKANDPLTRRQILSHWPEQPRPNSTTLWRWLDRGIERGLIISTGTGRCGSPLVYSIRGAGVVREVG